MKGYTKVRNVLRNNVRKIFRRGRRAQDFGLALLDSRLVRKGKPYIHSYNSPRSTVGGKSREVVPN